MYLIKTGKEYIDTNGSCTFDKTKAIRLPKNIADAVVNSWNIFKAVVYESVDENEFQLTVGRKYLISGGGPYILIIVNYHAKMVCLIHTKDFNRWSEAIGVQSLKNISAEESVSLVGNNLIEEVK